MRALVLLFSLHLSGDHWLSPDKVKHFFVSSFVESVAYGALRYARVDRGPALAGAAAATVVAGVGKEAYDAHAGSGFSARDLTWDLAGAAAAAALLDRAR